MIVEGSTRLETGGQSGTGVSWEREGWVLLDSWNRLDKWMVTINFTITKPACEHMLPQHQKTGILGNNELKLSSSTLR